MTARCLWCRRLPRAAEIRCGSRCAAAHRPQGMPTTRLILSRCWTLTPLHRWHRPRPLCLRRGRRGSTAHCAAMTPRRPCRPRHRSRPESSSLRRRTRHRRTPPPPIYRRWVPRGPAAPASAAQSPSRPSRPQRRRTSRNPLPAACWTATSRTSLPRSTPPPLRLRRRPMMPPRLPAKAPMSRSLPAPPPSCLTPAPSRRPRRSTPGKSRKRTPSRLRSCPRASRCPAASATAALK